MGKLDRIRTETLIALRRGLSAKKVKKVMEEWKEGELRSGSKHGAPVTSQKQAVAIALSEARRQKKSK